MPSYTQEIGMRTDRKEVEGQLKTTVRLLEKALDIITSYAPGFDVWIGEAEEWLQLITTDGGNGELVYREVAGIVCTPGFSGMDISYCTAESCDVGTTCRRWLKNDPETADIISQADFSKEDPCTHKLSMADSK